MKIQLMNLPSSKMIHYFLDLTSKNAECVFMFINNQTKVNKMKLGGEAK